MPGRETEMKNILQLRRVMDRGIPCKQLPKQLRTIKNA